MFEGFEVNKDTTWEDLINFVIRNADKSHDYRVRSNTIYIGIMNVEITLRKEDFSLVLDLISGEWHMRIKNNAVEVCC